MLDSVGEFITIWLGSTVKFVVGPLMGSQFDLPVWQTATFTVFGMMTSVIVFSFLGEKARDFFKSKFTFKKKGKRITNKTRNLVKIWKKFGIEGIAFITPLILTPIGGTLIATGFGVKRRKIIPAMFLSAVFWAFIISFVFTQFKQIPAMFAG